MSTTESASKPNMEDERKSDGDQSKEKHEGNGLELRHSYVQTIFWTCVFGLFFASLIGWMCINGQPPRAMALNILTAVLGALIGWALAMFYAPYNSKDASQFAQLGKTVSAFFTGYIVSKLDRFLELSLFEKVPKDGKMVDALAAGDTWFRAGIFFCSLLLGFLTIYSNRAYANVSAATTANAKDSALPPKGDTAHVVP